MANITELFADEMADLHLDLRSYNTAIMQQVNGELHRLAINLEKKVRSGVFGPAGPAATAQRRRAERIIKDSINTVRRSYYRIENHNNKGMRELAAFQSDEIVESFNSIIKADFFTPLNATRLRVITEDTLIRGGPAQDWWDRQAIDTQAAFATNVRQGVVAGETTDDIVRRVRGRATGKRMVVKINGKRKIIPEFTGGIMEVSTRNARSLVLTSTAAVGNRTYEETYRANDDITKGMQAIATLDSKTTPVCMARDRGAWDFEGNPLEESTIDESYPGPPPWHFRCRTFMVPIMKSWQDLADEAAKETGKKVKIEMGKVPARTRSSIDGAIARKTSWNDFLKRKGDAWARKKLGPQRFELWKEGKITLQQLIKPDGTTRSIAELKALRAPSKKVKTAPKPAPAPKPKPRPRNKPASQLAEETLQKWDKKYDNLKTAPPPPSVDTELRQFQQSGFKDIYRKLGRTGSIPDEDLNMFRLYKWAQREGDDVFQKAAKALEELEGNTSKRRLSLYKSHAEARAVKGKLDAQVSSDLHAKLTLPKNEQMPVDLQTKNFHAKWKAQGAARADVAASWIRKIFRKDRLNLTTDAKWELGVRRSVGTGGRAYHMGSGPKNASFIHMSEGSPIRTYIHEMGHSVEAKMPSMLQKTLRFLKNRIANVPQKEIKFVGLKRVLPDHGYGAHEKTWARRVKNPEYKRGSGKPMYNYEPIVKVSGKDSHAYYTSKGYHGFSRHEGIKDDWVQFMAEKAPKEAGLIPEASEMLSMGLEHLYADPYGFWKNDPEFFKFIVDLIQ